MVNCHVVRHLVFYVHDLSYIYIYIYVYIYIERELKGLCSDIFVCVEVLWPSQPNGVMSSAVSLPNHTFTGQA